LIITANHNLHDHAQTPGMSTGLPSLFINRLTIEIIWGSKGDENLLAKMKGGKGT